MTKLRLETLGGVGSILLGLSFSFFIWTDKQHGESMWLVWLLFMGVMIVNGVAMVRHVRPLTAFRKDGTRRYPDPVNQTR